MNASMLGGHCISTNRLLLAAGTQTVWNSFVQVPTAILHMSTGVTYLHVVICMTWEACLLNRACLQKTRILLYHSKTSTLQSDAAVTRIAGIPEAQLKNLTSMPLVVAPGTGVDAARPIASS